MVRYVVLSHGEVLSRTLAILRREEMDIICCVKQVPDTEAEIRPTADHMGINYEGVKFVINVYDEYAIEEALRIKERLADVSVTIVTLAPSRGVEAVRTALAMGADKGVLLDDPILLKGDAHATAKALAAAIKMMPHDLILCGLRAIDDDSFQVGQIIAESLGLPGVMGVVKIDISADKKQALVHRQIEGGVEVLAVRLPAVLGATKGLNEPRYPSLPGIMKAKKKEIGRCTLGDLGLTPDDVAAKTRVTVYSLPPIRKGGKVIEGATPEEKAAQLARLLREEAKVI